MLIVYLACIMAVSVALQCKNGAKPILTRTRSQPFLLEYKCLCPFNFFGPDCDYYRKMFCYISSSS